MLAGSPAEVFSDLDLMQSLKLTIPEPIALAARLRAAGLPIAQDALTIEAIARELLAID